jgi:virulence factor Mce-like protein
MNNPRAAKRIPNWGIGLIAIVLVVIAFYLAFAKSLPFAGEGYQLRAVFQDAQNIRVKSPVRVAGVDVGEVTEVEHLLDENGDGLDGAVITMRIDDEGRPVREDVTLQLRPRLFLEGNLFVDMHPGSPGEDELEGDSLIPIEQTSASVQLDQVLTSLQKPVRDDLQLFLKEFGGALDRFGGAEGFRELFRTSAPAYRSTSQVNEALLGTQPGDLAGLVRNLDSVVEALDRNEEQLKGLVTNARVVTGSFAAESDALEEAIVELPRALEVGRPALAKLNTSFPALRAFSRELRPGVRVANRTLSDTTPFIRQLRKLVSKKELRGLTADLRPTVPNLADLAKSTVPFLEEARALSSCFNNVVIPWSNTDVPSSSDPAGPVYKETGYSFTGVAGESRSGDANGQWFRVLGGGGTNTIDPFPSQNLGAVTGVVPFDILGSQPAKQSSAKTPFRPDVPCETQEAPDLRSDVGPAPETSSSGTSATASSPEVNALSRQFARIFMDQMRADLLEQNGRLRAAELLRLDAAEELRTFTKQGLPDYRKAVAELTGVGG